MKFIFYISQFRNSSKHTLKKKKKPNEDLNCHSEGYTCYELQCKHDKDWHHYTYEKGFLLRYSQFLDHSFLSLLCLDQNPFPLRIFQFLSSLHFLSVIIIEIYLILDKMLFFHFPLSLVN